MSHNPVCYGPGVPNLQAAPPAKDSKRNPAASDINYPIGYPWVNDSNNTIWFLTSKAAGAAVWTAAGSGAVGGVVTITGGSGGAESPLAGNFTLAPTANQILVTGSANTETFSLSPTLIAPGSIASTTTITSGTGITATTGNIVASTGNIISTLGSISAATTVTGGTGLVATTGNVTISAVASGLVLTPTVVAAGATPQTANGRVVRVTFSGVSIASGATQVFVINNTAITGVNTVTELTWFGATAGSALSIASIVNAAGTQTITMTNGTSATMVTSTANITFTVIVLN